MPRRLRHTLALSLLSLALVACGGLSAQMVAAHGARDMLMASQRAGIERHDLGFFMNQWAEDAETVLGRGPQSGRFDRVFTYGQVEATSEQRFHGKAPAGRKLVFSGVTTTLSGKDVVVEWTATVNDSDGFEVNREVYKLRHVKGHWKVFHKRFWPLKTRIGTDTYEFGVIEWQRRDREVFEQRKKGDRRLEVVALIEAHRFREAHDVASKATEGQQTDALLWVMRGIAAIQAGEVQDAYGAFRNGVARNPKVGLPAFKAAHEAALTVRKASGTPGAVVAPEKLDK